MKKRIFIGLIILGIGVFLYLAYKNSFVEISINNPANDTEITYNIVNQETGENYQATSTSSSIKKIVSRGSYEVTVIQSGQSFYGQVTASGFLRSTKLDGELSPESSVRFVGDNPKSCMDFLQNRLISYTCGDYVDKLQIHQPATENVPTHSAYTPKPAVVGEIEGLAENSKASYLLFRQSNLETNNQVHMAAKIDRNLNLTDIAHLKRSDGNKAYLIKQYGDGFIVYDDNFSEILYYSSIDSNPQKLAVEASDNPAMVPISLQVNGAKFIFLYSSPSDGSEVIVMESIAGESKHYSFSSEYSTAVACGTNKLCLHGGDRLSVYDMGGDADDEMFGISKVAAISQLGDQILVINDFGVLKLNVESGAGYYEFINGDYRFRGIQPVGDNYMLHMTNTKNRGVVLLVEPENKQSDQIHRKVSELQKLPGVSFVSTYGKYIYVSADLGELVYDESLKSFVYDRAKMESVEQQVNTEIDRLGIDRNKYTITSNAF